MISKYINKVKEGDTKAFYNSSLWRNKRLEIIERDNGECQICKDEGKVVTKDLVVHHVKHLKNNPELCVEDDNLITVCDTCHEKLHPERLSSKQIEEREELPTWEEKW